MATPRIINPPQTPVAVVPIATAKAVAFGDLVGLSSGTLVRAEDQTWDTDLATTQAAFAALFLGMSNVTKAANVARVAGHPNDNEAVVLPAGVMEYDCASATFAVGDLVGAAKQSGNALESQKVVAVATEARAVGRVREAGTSVTRVKVDLLSAKLPAARQS